MKTVNDETPGPIEFMETDRPGLEEREYPAPLPLPKKPVVFGGAHTGGTPAAPLTPLKTIEEQGISAQTPYPTRRK